MIHQSVFDTSELLRKYGVNYAVLSPGSRNAPLTLSFARNNRIKKISIVDERSAAFIGLGISQTINEPVVLCCTSGSALLNYAPACAEAFYQKTPLIILSADRPASLIDQRDGQTIRQVGALSNFVKGTVNLPEDIEHVEFKNEYESLLASAIELSLTEPKGPVHINIPFREPFYPDNDQELNFSDLKTNDLSEIEVAIDFESYLEVWSHSNKKIILRGQDTFNEEYERLISRQNDVVVIADIISNTQYIGSIRKQDLFLACIEKTVKENLKPDILITSGKSLISKNLKTFFRNHKPKEHWHFEKCDKAPDTFQSITTHFRMDIEDFLIQLEPIKKEEFSQQIVNNYIQSWRSLDRMTSDLLANELSENDFSEFTSVNYIIDKIPQKSLFHLANSMPVRYANFIQGLNSDVQIFANRGTSGIDGSNSTAVGSAISSDKLVTILSGDLSFFYDRNAFFHQHPIPNLRIIVMNNGGGGIFRLLPEASALPELEQYFETQHSHSAVHLANEYNFEYSAATNYDELVNGMDSFFEKGKRVKILEIFTSPATNHWVFKKVKSSIQQGLK